MDNPGLVPARRQLPPVGPCTTRCTKSGHKGGRRPRRTTRIKLARSGAVGRTHLPELELKCVEQLFAKLAERLVIRTFRLPDKSPQIARG